MSKKYNSFEEEMADGLLTLLLIFIGPLILSIPAMISMYLL